MNFEKRRREPVRLRRSSGKTNRKQHRPHGTSACEPGTYGAGVAFNQIFCSAFQPELPGTHYTGARIPARTLRFPVCIKEEIVKKGGGNRPDCAGVPAKQTTDYTDRTELPSVNRGLAEPELLSIRYSVLHSDLNCRGLTPIIPGFRAGHSGFLYMFKE